LKKIGKDLGKLHNEKKKGEGKIGEKEKVKRERPRGGMVKGGLFGILNWREGDQMERGG